MINWPLFALMAVTASSVARTQQPTSFAVTWIIEPGEVSGERKLVRASEPVLEVRLLPERLFTVASDVVDERGKIVISKDAEIAHASSSYDLGCVINAKRAKQRAQVNLTSNTRNTCLVDTDRDGLYDHQSLYVSTYYALGANGKVRLFSKVTPTAFQETEPAKSQDSPFLQLRFDGFAGNNVRFSVCPQQQAVRPKSCLEGSVSRRVESLPLIVDVLGASFTIHRRTDDSIEVSVEKSFDRRALIIDAKRF